MIKYLFFVCDVTEKIEEVEQDDDVYEDPGNVERESDVTKKPSSDVEKAASVPPLPPGRRDVSPHRSDTVTMRDKPKGKHKILILYFFKKKKTTF